MSEQYHGRIVTHSRISMEQIKQISSDLEGYFYITPEDSVPVVYYNGELGPFIEFIKRILPLSDVGISVMKIKERR